VTLQAAEPRLVLASASASRRALLAGAGLRFEARPAAVDEVEIKAAAQAEGLPAGEAALLLAAAKAERIARRDPEALVIGCDQLLVCDGRWFDKPADMAGAADHLRALSGRAHVLETATVAWRGGRQVWQHLERPRLVMRPLGEEFIAAYLALEGEAVLGSVGAYRLEGPGVQLFERIEGEHSAILGLPLLPLLGFLRQHRVLLG
jgi:septum formation protein